MNRSPLPPFDDERGIVPNDRGSVAPGVYVTGWIKRGARGVIGSTEIDAKGTVDKIICDFTDGAPSTPARDRKLSTLIRERRPDVVDRTGWTTIGTAERHPPAQASGTSVVTWSP